MKLNGVELAGFDGVGPEHGKFVPIDEALEYALNRCTNNEGEKLAFLEWYYSGNWTMREAE